MCFGLGFRQLEYKQAFMIMGFSILASSVTSAFIFIPGCSGLFCGEDDVPAPKQTLAVPTPDAEKAEEVAEE